ncbi:MAG: PDZ domain-containing protein [Kofleriaceae bacterium]
MVRRDGGPPPIELTISIRDDKIGFSREESWFRTGGRFAIHDLPAGRFTVIARGDGAEQKIELALGSGERKSGIELVLQSLVTITGRIVEYGTQKPVPGIRVFARAESGGAGIRFSMGNGGSQDNVSDESGTFTVTQLPAGAIEITGVPKDLEDHAYGFLHATKMISGTGTVDIGELSIMRRRTKPGGPVGELGVKFAQQPRDTPISKRELKVSFIDPQGPAAKTELKVGDVITSVDGVAVANNVANAWIVMMAPPGTKLTLGLARGTTVRVVLAAP